VVVRAVAVVVVAAVVVRAVAALAVVAPRYPIATGAAAAKSKPPARAPATLPLLSMIHLKNDLMRAGLCEETARFARARACLS
jgi:hypothetical protein